MHPCALGFMIEALLSDLHITALPGKLGLTISSVNVLIGTMGGGVLAANRLLSGLHVDFSLPPIKLLIFSCCLLRVSSVCS